MTQTRASDDSNAQANLWRLSSNPPFGVVRKVLADSEYAIVLDDLNGDYREIELTVSRHAGSDDDDLFSLDDSGYPGEGESCGGGGSVMGFDGHMYGCMYGREQPGTVVSLALGDQVFEVATDPDGWWFQVVEDDDGRGLYRSY